MPSHVRARKSKPRGRFSRQMRVSRGVSDRSGGPGKGLALGAVYRYKRYTSCDLLSITTTAASAGASITLNNLGNLGLTTSTVQTVNFFSLTFGFTLADLPSYTQFTSLYERYRLDGVDIVLTPFYTVADAPVAAGNGSASGMFHTIFDYNDYGAISASGSALTSMRGRTTYRTGNITTPQPQRWHIKPRVAIGAYGGVGFAAYANMPAPWADTVSTDLEHYGMKWLFEIANTSAAAQFVNFKLEFIYHLSFTDVKG